MMNETLISDTNAVELSVTEISSLIKKTIDSSFSYVKVRGEISGLKIATSGHAYFSLKDSDAVISAACWRGKCENLGIKLEDGLEVICHGSITTFAGQSKYQLIVSKVELAGIGALMAKLELLKQKLQQEGLFDPKYKKALPKYPENVAVITSLSGVVIRDIIHRLKDRYPVNLYIYATHVQGDKCAEQVTQAIIDVNNTKLASIDLIIIARGGGSFEDLFPFNDEKIIRAAFASKIPIISAIGHEADFTLLDFVADLRAPTPTAAAELATPHRIEVCKYITNTKKQIAEQILKKIAYLNSNFLGTILKIPHPSTYINDLNKKLEAANKNIYTLTLNSLQKQTYYFADLTSKIKYPAEYIADLSKKLNNINNSIYKNISNNIQNRTYHLVSLASKINLKDAKNKIEINAEHLSKIKQKIITSVSTAIVNSEHRVEMVTKMLSSLSYTAVLDRGYTVVRDVNNNVVTSASNITSHDKLVIEFKDGKIDVEAL
ncbi:MAG: exodeoxyribonuclease VII large subunit [Sphingobacteriia bacterium]|nr:exodeoxyribonuclease VII large subunit [Sphingobacteriia bacterium]